MTCSPSRATSNQLATALVVVITTALVASYTIADFFLFTVALVLTDNPLVLAAIPFILSLVRPTTFVASILTIIIISKLQIPPGIGCQSREWVCITSGVGLRLDQRQQHTRSECTNNLQSIKPHNTFFYILLITPPATPQRHRFPLFSEQHHSLLLRDSGHKSPVHLANGTFGHLDTAFNEFDLAFRSEVHLHGVDKLRPPNTDAYNQHCNDADKNSTSLI